MCYDKEKCWLQMVNSNEMEITGVCFASSPQVHSAHTATMCCWSLMKEVHDKTLNILSMEASIGVTVKSNCEIKHFIDILCINKKERLLVLTVNKCTVNVCHHNLYVII